MSLDPIKSVLDGVSLLAPPWHRTAWGPGVVACEHEHHRIAVHGRAMCVKALNEILDVLPSFLFFVAHIPDSSAIQLLEIDTAMLGAAGQIRLRMYTHTGNSIIIVLFLEIASRIRSTTPHPCIPSSGQLGVNSICTA